MSDCQHEDFKTTAFIGRHAAPDGRIVGFTASFEVHCAQCLASFYFNPYHRFVDSRHKIELRCAPGEPPMEAPWVPGMFQCSKCLFRLVCNTLDSSSGAVGPDRKAPVEKCPNCDELMERITWQQQCYDLAEAASLHARRVRQLEDAWPEGREMPMPEDEER
jgi:hypothetical protein